MFCIWIAATHSAGVTRVVGVITNEPDPVAMVIEYDGAPHGLLITEKQRFTDDLLAFLRD